MAVVLGLLAAAFLLNIGPIQIMLVSINQWEPNTWRETKAQVERNGIFTTWRPFRNIRVLSDCGASGLHFSVGAAQSSSPARGRLPQAALRDL